MPLPFTNGILAPSLRESDSITFDPLGVAAILGNPRADLSAARLYVQRDRKTFRWPHTTMIGAALTPISTLVAHLAQYDSIHPAVSMCTKDELSIAVISNTIFRNLRINVENLWLRDVLNFRPSKEPIHIYGERHEYGRAANDIAIVLVKNVFDEGSFPDDYRHVYAIRWRRAVMNITGLLTGLLLCVGTIFSVLRGDIWALTLFFIYLSHWLVSTLISFTHLVKTTCPQIRQDNTIKFAIHERPPDIGGMVVFKGTQQEIETWYRTTLQFRRTLLTDGFHWIWIVTGTLSAISSVACMVNMTGIFQLAFLGVLLYSSVAELWLTQCARRIQWCVREAAGLGKVVILTENKSRTEAITRATLAVRDECSLAGIDWMELHLLPPQPIFIEYQKLLNALTAEKVVDIERVIQDFQTACKVDQLGPKNRDLVNRIIHEVRTLSEKGFEESATSITPSLKV